MEPITFQELRSTMSKEQEVKITGNYDEVSIADGDVITSVKSPSGKEVVVRATDIDLAMNLALQLDSDDLDPRDDRRLFWKATMYILPLICL